MCGLLDRVTQMWAARMPGIREPLRVEDIPAPTIRSDGMLIKVAAAGMCRSDFQLLDSHFQHDLPSLVVVDLRRSPIGQKASHA
jgi:D-arabinose 1-dehydrogenase-like Zn-dependent alcohol dehydrogenase